MLSEPSRGRTRTNVRTSRGPGLALAGRLSEEQKGFFEFKRASTGAYRTDASSVERVL